MKAKKRPGMIEDQSQEDPSKEGPFTIEKILQKRIRNGVAEYYIKWKNYADSDNTWQLADDINPVEILDDYEANERRKEKFIKKLKKLKEKDPNFRAVEKKPKGYLEGFQRGFSPERILGACKNHHKEKMFLMKWKQIDDADMVSAREAHQRCPHLVIEFYEKQLIWDQNSNEDDAENMELQEQAANDANDSLKEKVKG